MAHKVSPIIIKATNWLCSQYIYIKQSIQYYNIVLLLFTSIKPSLKRDSHSSFRFVDIQTHTEPYTSIGVEGSVGVAHRHIPQAEQTLAVQCTVTGYSSYIHATSRLHSTLLILCIVGLCQSGRVAVWHRGIILASYWHHTGMPECYSYSILSFIKKLTFLLS